MDILVIISQALLYISFALLTGSLLLLLVPASFRPALQIPKRLIQLCALSIPILAFFPVLSITLYIAPRLGLAESFKIVLTTYTIGTAWVATLIVSCLLVFLLALVQSLEKKLVVISSLLLVVLLVLTVAWSSHAAALNPVIGITSDFLHLFSVSVWVGTLIIVGWCSKNADNWIPFLKWYSLVAISCLSITALSGIFLMDMLVDGYIAAWPVSYGQGLLIKHLFLLPLILFILANAFLVKFKLSRNPHFNPLRWIRVEALTLLTVFIITAIFTQQAPPHGHFLTNDTVSPLFRLFYDGAINANNRIGFVVHSSSVTFFFGALASIGLTIVSIVKKTPAWLSFLLGCCVVICVYCMIMVTIVVR